MNGFSCRLLLAAITVTGVSAASVTSANEYWLLVAKGALVSSLGIAAVLAMLHGRGAPFAMGFAAFAAVARWIDVVDLDRLADFSVIGPETELLRQWTPLAFGCVGGIICRHLARRAAGDAPHLLTTLLAIALIAACATVVVWAAIRAVTEEGMLRTWPTTISAVSTGGVGAFAMQHGFVG